MHPNSPTTPHSEHRLPTLFGRLTILLSAQAPLTSTLDKLHEMCRALEVANTSLPPELEPGVLLAALHRKLAQHFAAEESDEHFGQIAEERPGLLPRIVDLKGDHVALLQTIDTLAMVAADRESWHELPAPVARLVAALEAHEQAEAALVQQFLAKADVTDGHDARSVDG